MKPVDLVPLRRKAEEAVADMTDGPLKMKAFEVILGALLATPSHRSGVGVPAQSGQSAHDQVPTSLAGRIALLAEEGFFTQPRSLGEIQATLAEHGWHYPQTNLSTPLIRLVRRRQLRRLQLAVGNKKVWKYSLP